MNPIVVAITGASGAVYGRRTIERAVQAGCSVDLVVSDAGRRVAQEELALDYDGAMLHRWLGADAVLVRLHPVADIGASIASGSYGVRGMVIVPCSLGTVGRVAAGLSSNLIERAADVQLKERRPLILVVRETPLSTLHLENLLRLSRAGATVMPAAPGFYAAPRSVDDLVDFVVDRALAALGVENPARARWTGSRPQ